MIDTNVGLMPPRLTPRRHVRPHLLQTEGRGAMTVALVVALPASLLALALSLFGIGSRGLWNDEYATWHAATLPWGDLFHLLNNVDAVLTPYYVAMHGWIAVFGDSPASLRTPSGIAMALAAAVVALIGRRLFDPAVGLTAGLIFAALPAASRYGQEARPYAFAVAAASLATLLLLRAIDKPSWRRWMLYGACLSVAGMLHIVTLTVLLAHFVFVWRSFRDRDDYRLFRWIGAVVLAMTFALPLASKGSHQTGAIAWIKADGNAVRDMPGQLFGSWQVALAVFAVACLASALLSATRRNETVMLLVWGAFPPLFCYLTFPLLHLFLHRYLLFTLPAWALLAAAVGFALTRFFAMDKSSVTLSLSALLVLAAVLYVGESGQIEARRNPVGGEPDFRAAANILAPLVKPGDGIAFAGDRNGRIPFAYELRDRAMPRDVFVERTGRQNGEFGAQECEVPAKCLGATRRIWLISATIPGGDVYNGMSPVLGSFLTQAFDLNEFKQLENVRILVLIRKDVQ
jgi:mannosyltransferase